MGKREDAEKAFTAGFEDKEYKIDAEAEENNEAAEKLAAETAKPDEVNLENAEKVVAKETEVPAVEVDEWEGIPDNVRARFETMSASLDKATQIANSASGRANKLQSALDKQKVQKPVEAAKPTKDQILEAFSNKEKRDVLREEFGEFASALDEMDISMSNSVGSAIDNLRNELRQESKNLNKSTMAELQVKRNLDINHPGWETTVQDKDFKSWVFQGGPSEQESTHYDALLNQATLATPDLSAAAWKQANDYYDVLLINNPTWADEKGSLYGDSSGEAAISLLDNFKLSRPSEVVTTQAEISVNKNKARLEDNISPTSGKGLNIPQSETEDVQKAFEDGFTNSTY